MGSVLLWKRFATKAEMEMVRSQSESLGIRTAVLEEKNAVISAIGKEILNEIAAMREDLNQIRKVIENGFVAEKRASDKTVEIFQSDYNNIVKKVDGLETQLGSLHEDTKKLQETVLASRSSITAMLKRLEDNKLTKDDMESLASFLRFIAANQLLLEGRLCGEESVEEKDV